MTGQRNIALVLADRILEILEESGASEAERYCALEVAKAIVPVLPNASCSVEANEVASGSS